MGVLRRFPPISKNCVAHLATHFLPAVSERRSEWPTSDTRERSRAAVAPLGQGLRRRDKTVATATAVDNLP